MTNWMIFSKTVFDSIIDCISTSFKKEIRTLSHTAQKLEARQFPQICLSEKAPSSFFDILKTVLVDDLTF